ncbi:MAG: glutathione peroxidase [Bacteroidales bacterium]|nr:glutathione peroxidase [Bacteroidales bacterium]
MKKIITLFCAIGMFFGAIAQTSIYDFTVKDQNGKDVKLSEFKGKYLLIVNTATQCGFTKQYAEMQHMYNKFMDEGFVILDFPCNQFGEQAPGSDAEIHNFCTQQFNITFPQFKKIDVNGENALPLFTWLKAQKGYEGADNSDIQWNFTKFVIDKNGKVVKRFEPTTDMYDVQEFIYRLMFN